MSYTGTEGETSAVFRRDLEPLMLGATAATFVAPGSVTNGQFGLYRWDMGPEQGGARPHFHRTMSESFFVLGGLSIRDLRKRALTEIVRGAGRRMNSTPTGRHPIAPVASKVAA